MNQFVRKKIDNFLFNFFSVTPVFMQNSSNHLEKHYNKLDSYLDLHSLNLHNGSEKILFS